MIRAKPLLLTALLATALPSHAHDPAAAPDHEAMMKAMQAAGTPGAPHAMLAKMVGDYDLSIRAWHAPGKDPTVEKGTAKRSMILGGRVLVEEVQSQMMGQAFTGYGLHGYDNVSGKHWSTWNDSMGTGLMVSEGTCDAQGTCTFTGSWNDPLTKGKVTARMTSKWTDEKTEVFEMYAPGPDGAEAKMMEIVYTKK